MNIHKYVIPASIAATVHVALLWFLPEEPYIPPPVEVAVKPVDISDRPVQPPDEPDKPDTAAERVQALRGEPPPVSLDEPPPGRVDTTMFNMPVEPSRPEIALSSHQLPRVIGDPNGVLNGEFRPPSSFIDFKQLDGAPRPKVQIPPEYPYAMKQNGSSGSVMVQFDVDTSGNVIRAEAVSYSDRAFVEPAVRAVRKWRFEPGRRNGKAVPFRMTIPIEFGIENER